MVENVPVRNDMRTYGNIRKMAIGQADDNINGCLLDYPYFKENYRKTEIDLRKQQSLDANQKAIQQISFTRNLNQTRNKTTVIITKEFKSSYPWAFTRNCKTTLKVFHKKSI